MLEHLKTTYQGLFAVMLAITPFAIPLVAISVGDLHVPTDGIQIVESEERVVHLPPAEEPAEEDEEPATADAPDAETKEVIPSDSEGTGGSDAAPVEDMDGSTRVARHSGEASGRGGGGGGIMYRPDDAPDGPTRQRKKAGGQRCVDPTPGIESLGGRTWEIERRVVEYYAGNRSELGRLGGIARYKGDDIVGYQVHGIRCGNALDQAGFRNGDVVKSVNGTEVKGLFTAWAAYRKFKRADVVTIEVWRGGRVVKMTYRMT